MRSIFFCITPLECLIASKIIKKKKIKKEECELFFFNSIYNSKIDHYFKILNDYCKINKFYLLNKRFPKFIFDIQKYFKNKKYSDVYVAALDSVIIHTALSSMNFTNLYTYDDGLGNILKNSVYYNKRKHPILKRLLYFMLGNRYSTKKIINKSSLHFTIFKKYKNVVSSNTETVDILPNNKYIFNGKKCSILLGTVFDEYYNKNDINIRVKFQKFIDSIKGEKFYIDHPREKEQNFKNIIYEKSNRIAEEIISDYLTKYETINLYGFMSTTQFNFIEVENIKHHFILNNELRVNEGIKLLRNKNFFIHKL